MNDLNFKSGFFTLVGRPNTGKSTLMNALVGAKIAITSSKTQTTRHAIRGILNKDNYQIVVVDTPGIHKPKNLLGKLLNEITQENYMGVDVIGICLPANESIGPGDKFIIDQIQTSRSKANCIFILTKTDLVKKESIINKLIEIDKLYPDHEIIAVSSKSNKYIKELELLIVDKLPFGDLLYDKDEVTDETDEKLICEFIREASLERFEQEIPHSIAVTLTEMDKSEKKWVIYANIHIERDSQKSILIGKNGSVIKDIGIQSRKRIEEVFAVKVFLDLQVKVAKDWQRDSNMLGKLGF